MPAPWRGRPRSRPFPIDTPDGRWCARCRSGWGPDLRVAFLAGDEATVSRVEGRQALGSGWVSHILQEIVVRLWKDPETLKRLQDAGRTYEDRRLALLRAVRRRFLKAEGRSGAQRLDQRA